MMLLSLRAVVQGKSGAGSASRGLGVAGEPPDAAVIGSRGPLQGPHVTNPTELQRFP